jgi:hypothetical protein
MGQLCECCNRNKKSSVLSKKEKLGDIILSNNQKINNCPNQYYPPQTFKEFILKNILENNYNYYLLQKCILNWIYNMYSKLLDYAICNNINIF